MAHTLSRREFVSCGGAALGSALYARGLTMRNSNWATNPLNIAIRVKSNLNRGGFVENIHVRDVELPHGVSLQGASYGSSLLKDGPINRSVPVGVVTRAAANPSTSQGGLITLDCDYMPAGDAIRTRPPVLRNIHIANVRARNVQLHGATGSCFQALVVQGPVASDYNGLAPVPPILPIENVSITDCDLGSPTAAGPAGPTAPGPVHIFNARATTLRNVRIGDRTYNTELADDRYADPGAG